MARPEVLPPPRFPWEPEGLRVRIQTPEQVALEFQVASFGLRILAGLVDLGLQVFFLLWLLLVLRLLFGPVTRETAALLTVLSPFLHLFYFFLFELRLAGQTPGKRLLKCRVITATGQSLTAGKVLLRTFTRIADEIPLFWLVPALDPLRRRLGDLVAGTLVVLLEPEPGPSALPPVRRLEERRFVFAGRLRERVVREDLDLLEYFFRQRRRLQRLGREGYHLTRRAATDVANRYVRRLGLADQAEAVRADPERFLQELYLFLRETLVRDTF